LPAEAPDPFALDPVEPLPAFRRWFVQEERTARTNPPDLLHTEREPAEVAVETRPLLARRCVRRSRARDEVKTLGPVGAGGALDSSAKRGVS